MSCEEWYTDHEQQDQSQFESKKNSLVHSICAEEAWRPWKRGLPEPQKYGELLPFWAIFIDFGLLFYLFLGFRCFILNIFRTSQLHLECQGSLHIFVDMKSGGKLSRTPWMHAIRS